MTRFRVLDVNCRCGQHLFEYAKGGRGRLIKCFLDQIRRDEMGVVDAPPGVRLMRPNSLAGWDYAAQPPAGWTIAEGRLGGSRDSTPLLSITTAPHWVVSAWL